MSAQSQPASETAPPRSLRACFVGGGTGGHLYPLLAVAEALRELEPRAELLFIGARTGAERDVLEREGHPYRPISARPVPYRVSPESLLAPLWLLLGLGEAARVLVSFEPHVLVTTGGYVAASVVPAAWSLGVPVVLHDSDALTGRANRLLARWASAVTVAYESARERLNGRHVTWTGQPIRRAVLEAEREPAAAALGVNPRATTVLVTGGSRGARSINSALVEALPELLKQRDLQILHVAGRQRHAEVLADLAQRGIQPGARYHVWDYLYDLHQALACADLVVCRGGSNSLWEAAARGLPAIIVPYPYAAAHQEANAEPFLEAGAAVLVRDAELSGEALVRLIGDLVSDVERRERMGTAARSLVRPEAAVRVAEAALTAARPLRP